MKSLTTLSGTTRTTLEGLIEAALDFSSRPGTGEELAGTVVANLFFEPSTRTRLSFHLAARRLGAEVLTFDPPTSSVQKGESERDTARTVAAIGADILVVRHPVAGTPDMIHEWTGRPVVNAGDGTHQHPTQALVDAVTLVRHFGAVEGLRMGIVGDIRHSRVAASLMCAMPVLGVELILVGPEPLLPDPGPGPSHSDDLDQVIGDLDVVYLLRVQKERGVKLPAGYTARFGLTTARAAVMRPTAVVMHPGPVNRGIEVADPVADGPRSLILDQVSNGVPTRMAVLAAVGEAAS